MKLPGASADRRRLAIYAGVALAAAVVYLAGLKGEFVMDDLPIVRDNPLVHAGSGWWRAFAMPYWPPLWGGHLYRPLVIASYWLDFHLGAGPAWFHAVNLCWHAAVAVLVAGLAHRWAGARAALAAGLLFAVHPVHVEAVANVVGRAELMAAFFSLLAVVAALFWDRLWLAVGFWILGLCCKENAAVVPALVALGWWIGVAPRPSRRRAAAWLGAALAAGAVYAVVRVAVLRPYSQFGNVAVVFLQGSPLQIRLTAVAALADVGRLLVFPLHLRVDYSPLERTLVTSPADPRCIVGVLAAAAWGLLLIGAWRRGWKLEAFGLAWIGISFAPVANLFFPIGVLVAERTLYLPSVGLALAAGAVLARVTPLRPRLAGGALAAAVVAGGIRTAARVPVWRSNETFVLSVLDDSPASYFGPFEVGQIYLAGRQWTKALDAFDRAWRIWPWDARAYVLEAYPAFRLGRAAYADSLLAVGGKVCDPCRGIFGSVAGMARALGDSSIADTLVARYRGLGRP